MKLTSRAVRHSCSRNRSAEAADAAHEAELALAAGPAAVAVSGEVRVLAAPLAVVAAARVADNLAVHRLRKVSAITRPKAVLPTAPPVEKGAVLLRPALWQARLPRARLPRPNRASN